MWIIATGLIPVNADAMMQWYFSSTVPGLQHYSLSSMPSIQRCLLLCQHETHQTSELGFVQTQYALFRLLYLILLSRTPSSNFPSEFLPENFGNRIRSTTKTSDSEKCLTFQAHADVVSGQSCTRFARDRFDTRRTLTIDSLPFGWILWPQSRRLLQLR